jgi:uncharacterized protein
MQTGRFYRISVALIILVSIFVLIKIGMQAAKTMPLDLGGSDSASSTPLASGMIAIKAPKGTIRAIVASTSPARERGLSGTPSMPKDSGMLFVFPTAGVYGFWMKDMAFAIDMVWIDADKNVSGVALGVSPETYPEIFYPTTDVRYVLELNARASLDYGIATGTKLVF